jgi:hypothetical protein
MQIIPRQEDKMAKFYFYLICLIFIIAVGCGKTAEEKAVEKQIEKATGGDAKVDISKKGMKIEGETAEGKYSVSTGESVKIPKDFPDDVFIFSPSKAIAAMKMAQGYSISLKTGKKVEEIAGTYKEEMESRGWSEQTSMKMGPQTMLVYKKESRIANITVAEADDETQINLTVTSN